MLFVTWLAEQGVWIAPLVGAGLWVTWPETRRGWLLNAALVGLAGVFVANAAGFLPPHVTCDFSHITPICTKTTGTQAGEGRQRGPSQALGADVLAGVGGSAVPRPGPSKQVEAMMPLPGFQRPLPRPDGGLDGPRSAPDARGPSRSR